MSIQRRKIIETIQRLHSRGEPLNISAVKRSHPELIRAVYDAVPFWGWKRALEDAGIDYFKIKVELEDVIECELCGKSFHNLASHLLHKHQTQSHEYLMDYPGTDMVSEALRARITRMESSSLRHWEPIWSREYILDRLAEYHRRGFSLNHSKMTEIANAFVGSTILYFGSWDKALRHIGLNAGMLLRQLWRAKSRYPDGQAVLTEIRRRWNARLPVHSSALCTPQGDTVLVRRGCEYFGSWPQVLRAAGLDVKVVRRATIRAMALRRVKRRSYPDKASVIKGIRERRAKNLPLTSLEIQKGADRNPTLLRWASKYFGSWAAAVSAAGIDLDSRRRAAALKRRRYPDKASVIKGIRERRAKRLPLNASQVAKVVNGDQALPRSAIEYFGSWAAAVSAAGIDLDSIRRAEALKRRSYPDKASVIKGIRERRAKRLPLNASQVLRGLNWNKVLLRWATKCFGSWSEALRAAGLDPEKIYLRAPKQSALEKQAFLNSVRKFSKSRKSELMDSVWEFRRRNWRSARKIKGWEKVCDAAGVPEGHLLRTMCARGKYPDGDFVISAIKQRQRLGWPLSWKDLKSGEHKNYVLYKRASECFGSMRNAIEAANRQTP